jgi:hypothetical protein
MKYLINYNNKIIDVKGKLYKTASGAVSGESITIEEYRADNKLRGLHITHHTLTADTGTPVYWLRSNVIGMTYCIITNK